MKLNTGLNMAWYMTFSQNPILGLCDVYQISLET